MVCQKICASQKEDSKNETVVDIILHKPQPYTYAYPPPLAPTPQPPTPSPYPINNDRFQSSLPQSYHWPPGS